MTNGHSTPLLTIASLHKSFGGVEAVGGVSFDVRLGQIVALIGPNGAGKTTTFNCIGGQLRPDSGKIIYNPAALTTAERIRLEQEHELDRTETPRPHDITGRLPRRIARLGIGRTFQITATFASMTVLENVQMVFVALLGRNGAGKSTTMKAIIGAVQATSGAVLYRGQDLRKLRSYRRARLGLGYVPEDRRIFSKLTVLENLLTAQRHVPGKQVRWTIEGVIKLFPKLEELKDHLGGQLSGGEQQMLTVARTLMTNPDCLLLDEPTEGLAPVVVEQVNAAIVELKKQGLAILLSEQNRHTAAGLADRVVVLEKGRAIYQGSVASLSVEAHKALGW